MTTFSYAQAAKGTTPAVTNNAITESNDIKIDAVVNESSDNQPNTAASVSGSTSSSANDGATCSSESVRDEDEQNVDTSARRSEAGSHSGGRRQQEKKGRQEKKKDVAVTESEAKPEPIKVELTEAPVPQVNIWQQRMKSKPASESKSTEQASTKADKNEAPEGSSRKSRAPRSGDKDAKNAEQIIADTTNWPTPDTAMKEKVVEKATPKPIEKPSETVSEDDVAKGKQSKKVWEKVEFTPTARFETQIPGHRGPRTARGTPRPPRENSSRTHNGTKDSEKSPSASNHVKGEHKERSHDNSTPRTTSQPPKKGDHQKEHRKSAPAHASFQSAPKDVYASNESTPHRSENRGERPPRGNSRSRGGYHNNNGPSPINTQQFNGYTNGNSRQNIVSPSRQSYSGNYQGRGHRGGRNHSISMRNNRQSANYTSEYGMHGMAPAYPMYPDPGQTAAMFTVPHVMNQFSYYFSIDNLCKDIFLRKHMDSQGFVPLKLFTQFKRISEFTANDADSLETIREACAHLALPSPEGSALLELVIGDDNVERVRLANGWDKFIVPVEDRVESQRNEGPAAYQPHPQINNAMIWQQQQQQYASIYPIMSPTYPAYPLQGYRAFNNGYQYAPMNAGNNVYAPSFNASNSAPLSANVPSFSPSVVAFPAEGAAASAEAPAPAEAQN